MRLRWIAPSIAACTLLAAGGFVGSARANGAGGWDHLGHGATATTPALNGSVYALNTDDPGQLLVGGSFTDAAGIAAADYIAKWNGTSWSTVSSPASQLNGAVNAIAYSGGVIYAGGNFTNAGGDPKADFVAAWNGTSWASICSSSTQLVTASVSALQIIGSTLYVGGSFGDGGGLSSADRLVACNVSTGVATSTIANAINEFNGAGVYGLAKDASNNLYAVGGFINLDGNAAADHVAYMDGTGWHAMGSGAPSCGCAVDSIARSVTVVGSSVYIGTDSQNIGGIAQADNVARWDGTAWSAVGSNTAGTDGWFPNPTVIDALAGDGTTLYAAGTFVNANGDLKADNIAAYDGTAWHSVGDNGTNNGPLSQAGTSLAFYGSKVHVGGLFTSAGDDSLAHGVARYPGYLPSCNPVIITGATGGIPVPIHLSCTDKTNVPVQFQIRSSPAHGTLGSTVSPLGKVVYTPDVGYQGSDQFTYRGTNSDGDSATKTVTITGANRGYTQSADNVSIKSAALTASKSGVVTIRLHNTNTFALRATSVRLSAKGHGTVASNAKDATVGAGKAAKVRVDLTTSKLKLLKRRGHLPAAVTIKFAGPHHSHSVGKYNTTLKAPK